MYTPGYENENKTKPSITKIIEEADPGLTPEQAAAAMLKGKRRPLLYTPSPAEQTKAEVPPAFATLCSRSELCHPQHSVRVLELTNVPYSHMRHHATGPSRDTHPNLHANLYQIHTNPSISSTSIGVQKNRAHFTADLITELFRVSTRGSAPNNNIFVDALLNFIAWVRKTNDTAFPSACA